MNLKELKKIIAEEYSAYTEQAEPAVDVEPGDVDMEGEGEDAEATLRHIYDMLKAHFEGEDEADEEGDDMGAGEEEADIDGDGDVDADDANAAQALQERFKKLANIVKG